MMSLKPIVLFLAVAAALPTKRAFSADHIPGSACKVSFNSTGTLNYFDGEVFNNTGATQFVDCPSRRNRCFNLQVHYLDKSSASGANFRCYGYRYAEDGSIVFSASKFSCSTSGGCTTNLEPNFSATTQRFIELPPDSCWQGVTCELPASGTIRFVRRVF
jgi:hypothetical protein